MAQKMRIQQPKKLATGSWQEKLSVAFCFFEESNCVAKAKI